MAANGERDRDLCERLDNHSHDWEGGWPLSALLRTPGAVVRFISEGRQIERLIFGFSLGTIVLAAVYGAILGMYVPGLQTLYAALKVPAIVLGTALLCTPTFHIFNTILGASIDVRQSLALVMSLTSAAALILVAFAPIAWFFTVSTDGFAFLSLLHVAVFLVAFFFGARFLSMARAYLAYLDPSRVALHAGFLRLWFAVVLFVGFQMAYVFRPILTPGDFCVGERGLFFEFVGKLFS